MLSLQRIQYIQNLIAPSHQELHTTQLYKMHPHLFVILFAH